MSGPMMFTAPSRPATLIRWAERQAAVSNATEASLRSGGAIEKPIDCDSRQSGCPGNAGDRFSLGLHASHQGVLLPSYLNGSADSGRPAHVFAGGPGDILTGAHALGPDLGLIGGHGGEHVRHEAAGGGREIQPILETDQVDLAGHKLFKERGQSLGGPSQSVEAPASQRSNLSGLDILCQLVPSRAIHRLAGELVPVPDNRAVLTVGPSLQVRFLACRLLASTGYPQVGGIVFPIDLAYGRGPGLALALAHDFPLPQRYKKVIRY